MEVPNRNLFIIGSESIAAHYSLPKSDADEIDIEDIPFIDLPYTVSYEPISTEHFAFPSERGEAEV